LASLMDARGTIISNNLNIRIKTLTLITIAIMLPTLVVSVFSMNVGIPLSAHQQGFWIILTIAAISAVSVGLLWWKRWW
jgi:magnesium transporter